MLNVFDLKRQDASLSLTDAWVLRIASRETIYVGPPV
jgi:hypothetical protein